MTAATVPSTPSPSTLLPWAAAVGIAAVHLFAWRVHVLDVVPRRRLLSAAGGSSVAYIFVHVLPEIARVETTLERRAGSLLVVEEHVYLLTLGGFVLYYGLERFVDRRGDRAEDGQPGRGTFWVHVGAFAAYNALIGYLLFHQEVPGVGGLVLFSVAMGLHLVVNDHGLRQRHPDAYRRVGRWLLAGAVLLGGTVGSLVVVGRVVVGSLFAVLAGGVVLNVVKEELPSDRESRFSAFAVGAGGYAALLLLA